MPLLGIRAASRVNIPEISTVCYVGAGTMGCYNSIVAAISGYQVVIYDVDAKILEQVAARHMEYAGFLVANGYCTEDAIAPALERVSLETDLAQATRSADLVSESIIERLDTKRDVHRQLDELCPARTILTTNTSALLVSDIEDAVARGERFAALHSHLGAPLVDIVGGPRTSPATLDILRRFTLSIGGVPLLLQKEHRGYVLNAMLGPLMSTGILLVNEQRATVEDVDRAWMHFRNAPMGPFAIMDLLGLNLIHDSWHYREAGAATATRRRRILGLLQPYVDKGELGMKSGKGFYQYPDPTYQQADFSEGGATLAPIHRALVTILIANAVELAAIAVAAPEQIDMAWMTGTYLDSGPFEILAGIGIEEFLQDLEGEVAAGHFEPDRAQRVGDYLQRNHPGHRG